jgi:hypothetical protein
MMLYSFQHFSTAATATSEESRKASAEMASKKGKKRRGIEAEKRKRELTEESVLQPPEDGMDLRVLSPLDAEFRFMLLVVRLPETYQLLDLGVTLFIRGILRHAELLHLGVILHREILLSLGHPLLKLLMQHRFCVLGL